MSSYPCPNCQEPVSQSSARCYRCGLDKMRVSFEPVKVLTGLSSSYYQLPEGCKELQDLIEYKNMNFARGNVFKAAYRLGDKPGTDQIYDWEKIIWFAQREIQRLKGDDNES